MVVKKKELKAEWTLSFGLTAQTSDGITVTQAAASMLKTTNQKARNAHKLKQKENCQ